MVDTMKQRHFLKAGREHNKYLHELRPPTDGLNGKNYERTDL